MIYSAVVAVELYDVRFRGDAFADGLVIVFKIR